MTTFDGGGLAERLRTGLQIREDRFDSGTRLQILPDQQFSVDTPCGALREAQFLVAITPANHSVFRCRYACFQTGNEGAFSRNLDYRTEIGTACFCLRAIPRHRGIAPIIPAQVLALMQ